MNDRTYIVDLSLAGNGTVIVAEGGAERDISRELRGLDLRARVGELTTLTLHSFGGARFTVTETGHNRLVHDDCSDCAGHDTDGKEWS